VTAEQQVPAPPVRVEVDDLVPTPAGGSRVATFTARAFRGAAAVPFVVIHQLKVIEGRSGGTFIALPSYRVAEGQYRDVVEVPAMVMDAIRVEALAAWAALQATPASQLQLAPSTRPDDDGVPF